MKTKQCSKCKEVKAVDDFQKDKTHKDGLRSQCNVCTSKSRRKRYEENRESIREYHRKYRNENRKVDLARQRKYREENREVDLARKRKYREENREVAKENGRKYARETQEMTRAIASKAGRYSLEEDLVVLDETLTIYQKAVKLGRTYGSVSARRYSLRKKASRNA